MAFWLSLLGVLIVVELVTPLELVTLWFMPGVIVCAILSYFDVAMTTQVAVFVVASIAGTAGLFLYMRRKSGNQNVTGERFSGTHRIQSVDADGTGWTKIKDVNYRVRSSQDEQLTVGDVVTVTSIQGNTLYVKRTEAGNG